MDTHQHQTDALYQALNTTPEGLSPQEALDRLNQHGPNQLHQNKSPGTWQLLLDAWKDPMMLILAVVVIIKAVLGEFVEAGVILAVIIVNSVISVVQTKKAESSLEALKKMSAPLAKVRRGGDVITMDAALLVSGDTVLLEPGDLVPADGRLTVVGSLKIDEGLLTGESEPVEKHTQPIPGNVPIGDRKNMAHSGTVVVYGRGEILVTATGKDAEIGKIATLIETAKDRQTPLQRRLEAFSKKLGFGIIAICALIFAMQIGRAITTGEQMTNVLLQAFLFALAVAVAAIPEALSPIITIVLAVGTKKMAAQHAIIRKLPAVEALGSTSVICTDKTGTLTQNKMEVVDYFLPGEGDVGASMLPQVMTLCNNAIMKPCGTLIGDPTETALLAFCHGLGKGAWPHQRIGEIPYDSARKFMTVLCKSVSGTEIFTKGAPDVLFPKCSHILIHGKVQPLSPALLAQCEAANNAFTQKALRVLAYAIGTPKGETLTGEDENNFILVGLTAMADPPRPEVRASIAQAKAAHIKTVMITGDHKNTACAIARDIGLMEGGQLAVTGQELDAMDTSELDAKLEDIAVFARVSPENKMTIVQAWQRKGMITAMTGDGVNDAPSLKQADIGVAMGSGTEVAKNAAAMVLADDNFTSIIHAVAIGRSIFDNITKAVGYLFSGNLAAIIAILFAFVVGWDSPLTALQILFINLVNDSIPAIALGLEKGDHTTMARPPRDMQEGLMGGALARHIALRGVLMAAVTIAAQYIGIRFFSSSVGGGMAFTTIILARTLQTFAVRSNTQSIFKLGFASNIYVLGAVGICLGLFAVAMLPGVREVFQICSGFGLVPFGIGAGLALLAVLLMELEKLLGKR